MTGRSSRQERRNYGTNTSIGLKKQTAREACQILRLSDPRSANSSAGHIAILGANTLHCISQTAAGGRAKLHSIHEVLLA